MSFCIFRKSASDGVNVYLEGIDKKCLLFSVGR